MDVLEADRITKIYSARKKSASVTALSEFSLRVRGGEIFGLLGPNGAGKTTFIKILLEIAFPTAGSARLFGVPCHQASIKNRIGYLPENHRYPPYLTGEQVLRYFGSLSGMDGPALERAVNEKLALVEMDNWRATRVRKYSKGMMQRLGLAQAILNDPDLVILDEPTDGVDPIGRKQIRELLVRLRDRGKTIFLNSHLLSEVEMICDRVAILNKGKLVRSGTVRELTVKEHLYEISVVGELPDALLLEWQARCVAVTRAGGILSLSVDSPAALNDVIDQLRGHGVLIDGVTQKRSSLEDMFIDIIARETP